MRTQIFISYRRDGGLNAAKALCERLSEKFEVFFDMNSLRNGRFDEAIDKSILECSDFLLILSPNAFSRFSDAEDWIRHEVKLALDNSKNIIPVFLDGFAPPITDNEDIKKTLLYNGLNFSEDNEFFDKLSAFLTSNKRCVLDIKCTEEGYRLCDSAVDNLKDTYKAILESGEYDVHVKLNLPDVNDSAKILNSAYSAQSNFAELVEFVANHLTKKHHTKCTLVETAIQFMISDKYNIRYAPVRLPEIPPFANESFTVYGVNYDYYVVCVWKFIIEELLKEFTIYEPNRINYYNKNRGEYYFLDCVIDRPSNSAKGNWYFLSRAKTIEEMPCSYYPLFKPQLFSLDAESIYKMIFPDFYYKAATEILLGNEIVKKEFLNPDSPIRSLANYWYGLS